MAEIDLQPENLNPENGEDNTNSANIPDGGADCVDGVDGEECLEDANIKVIKQRKKKQPFEKACDNCKKILKSDATYNKHITQQLCFDKDKITYCKVCNINLGDVNNYNKHLISLEHYNKIGCNKIEVLNNKQPSTLLLADPYLNSNEAKLLGTNNLGTKFTFVFKNGNTQDIKLEQSTSSISNNSNNSNNPNNPINLNNSNNIVNEEAKYTERSNLNNDNKVSIPSPRQQKVIDILAKPNTIEEGSRILLKMLDGKLHLDDMQGLIKIIRTNNTIKTEMQKGYIEVIEKFVNMLIKKRNNGETVFKGGDISKIVIALTS